MIGFSDMKIIEGLNKSQIRLGLEEEERSKIRCSEFQKWTMFESFCFCFFKIGEITSLHLIEKDKLMHGGTWGNFQSNIC